MDPIVESRALDQVMQALRNCGLARPASPEAVDHFFRNVWLDWVAKGVRRPTGFDVLVRLYNAVEGEFEYAEGTPDSDEIEIVLEKFCRLSDPDFSMKDITCSVIDDCYHVAFFWNGLKHTLSVPVDPFVVPVDEIAASLNAVLDGKKIERRFIGIWPPLPAETSGYVFATLDGVRNATKRGLVWSNV